MGIEDILAEFDEEKRTGTESPAWKKRFDELCQEAIRLGMEMNNQYHTPEELREIMGRLTGKRIDDTFRLFPPFYTDFGKNLTIGKEGFWKAMIFPERLSFRSVRLIAAGLVPVLWIFMYCARILWNGWRGCGLRPELPGMLWRNGFKVLGLDDS